MPILFTRPQRSKKKKPNASQRRLADDWEKLLALHSKPLEKGNSQLKSPKDTVLVLELTRPAGRADLRQYPSRVTPGGDAIVKPSTQYTGTRVLGISQMAKSNAVPVFSKQDAVDIARMRRN